MSNMSLQDRIEYDECVAQEIADAKTGSAKLPLPMVEKSDVSEVINGEIGSYMLRDNGNAILIQTPAGVVRLPVNSSEEGPKWTMTNENGQVSLTPSLAVSTRNSKGERIETFHGWIRGGLIVNA